MSHSLDVAVAWLARGSPHDLLLVGRLARVCKSWRIAVEPFRLEAAVAFVQRRYRARKRGTWRYSFALHPEPWQPSATLNFSRLDDLDIWVGGDVSVWFETR
jgi:hypothetical protein